MLSISVESTKGGVRWISTTRLGPFNDLRIPSEYVRLCPSQGPTTLLKDCAGSWRNCKLVKPELNYHLTSSWSLPCPHSPRLWAFTSFLDIHTRPGRQGFPGIWLPCANLTCWSWAFAAFEFCQLQTIRPHFCFRPRASIAVRTWWT